VISGLRELRRGIRRQTWDILRPVFSRPKKKWDHDNPLGATFDATGVCRRDRRFGDFHVGGFDDLISPTESACKRRRGLLEHFVAFRPAGAVIDDDNSISHKQYVARIT
jgi:hypothetical protein